MNQEKLDMLNKMSGKLSALKTQKLKAVEALDGAKSDTADYFNIDVNVKGKHSYLTVSKQAIITMLTLHDVDIDSRLKNLTEEFEVL